MSDYIFTEADAGVVLAGHHGWHNNYRVIELAVEHGMHLPHPEDQRIIDAYKQGEPEIVADEGFTIGVLDAIVEIGDEALDYLYSITAPGLGWLWDFGELSLVAEDEDKD